MNPEPGVRGRRVPPRARLGTPHPPTHPGFFGFAVEGGGGRQRETRGNEPFALHAPIQWDTQGDESPIQLYPDRPETRRPILRTPVRVVSFTDPPGYY
jgi:hypothetical protein